MSEVKYKYIDHGSNTLILAINDMAAAYEPEEKFMRYKSFIQVFPDCNILFIKETELQYWYLPHIDELLQIINKYSTTTVHILTSSSGGFAALHLMPHIHNLKSAVLVNIQAYLDPDQLNQYDDVCHIDLEKIGQFSDLFKPPVPSVAMRYYTCYNGSDRDFCDYFSQFPHIEIIKEPSDKNHWTYIQDKFLITEENRFYDEVRKYFGLQ